MRAQQRLRLRLRQPAAVAARRCDARGRLRDRAQPRGVAGRAPQRGGARERRAQPGDGGDAAPDQRRRRRVLEQLRQRRRDERRGLGAVRAVREPVADAVPARAQPGLHARGLVVEQQQLIDGRVGTDRADDRREPLALAPDHRRVVERVADRRRGRQQRREPLRGRGAERRQRQAEPPGLVGRQPAVAARAGQDREAPRAAGHTRAESSGSARARARPGPRAGRRRAPHARARHGQRLGELEQVVDVLGPCAARLLDERAEDPLVAGQRAGVRRGGGRARRGGADLQHRDADAALGRPRERRRQPCAVAVRLEEQRHRADVLLLGERGEQRRGVEHRLVADRRDGVEAQAAAERQRVDGDVAALRDERHAPGRPRHERVAPQRGRAVERHQPVAVRADQRHPGRRARELPLERLRARLGEAGREHDRGAAAAAAGRPDDLGHARGGDRDDDRVDRLRQVLERRHAGPPVHLAPRRVHAPDRARGSRASRGCAAPRRRTSRAGRSPRRRRRSAGAAAPTGPAPRRERGAVRAASAPSGPARRREPRRAVRRAGAQRSTFATPRRSSERAMISRWISLVPSQILSTRSSRRKRSATLSRR